MANAVPHLSRASAELVRAGYTRDPESHQLLGASIPSPTGARLVADLVAELRASFARGDSLAPPSVCRCCDGTGRAVGYHDGSGYEQRPVRADDHPATIEACRNCEAAS
jgi:hypothetical protein